MLHTSKPINYTCKHFENITIKIPIIRSVNQFVRGLSNVFTWTLGERNTYSGEQVPPRTPQNSWIITALSFLALQCLFYFIFLGYIPRVLLLGFADTTISCNKTITSSKVAPFRDIFATKWSTDGIGNEAEIFICQRDLSLLKSKVSPAFLVVFLRGFSGPYRQRVTWPKNIFNVIVCNWVHYRKGKTIIWMLY